MHHVWLFFRDLGEPLTQMASFDGEISMSNNSPRYANISIIMFFFIYTYYDLRLNDCLKGIQQ